MTLRTTPAITLLPPAETGVEMVAKFFRALADPTRLRLLEFLLEEEHTLSACVSIAGLSQGRVSPHLACLSDCGYVHVRRLCPHRPFPGRRGSRSPSGSRTSLKDAAAATGGPNRERNPR